MSEGNEPITDITKMEEVECDEEADVKAPEGHKCETPNRFRRTMFVFVSVGVAYVSVMALALLGNGKIAELVADALCSYMMVISVSYVAAHTLDRSEIFEKMGSAFGRRYNGTGG